jgi:RNA polymerase sigma-70 factor (ECF subfamily)
MPDDDALWRRVGEADAEAFGSLFERHGQAIYNYCFRRTANWGEAEDLTSIVFLEAWRRRRQRLEPGKVLAWLYGIAGNVVRNHRRSRRRFEAALARLAQPEQAEDSTGLTLERIDDERRMAELLALVAHLPRRQREVIALCDWSGLDYPEASVALGVPVGTVKSRLSRAHTRIRELLTTSGHKESENIPLEIMEREEDVENSATA